MSVRERAETQRMVRRMIFFIRRDLLFIKIDAVRATLIISLKEFKKGSSWSLFYQRKDRMKI